MAILNQKSIQVTSTRAAETNMHEIAYVYFLRLFLFLYTIKLTRATLPCGAVHVLCALKIHELGI